VISFKRGTGRSVARAVLWLALSSFAITPAVGQESEDPGAALEERIAELRADGEYAEALRAADELLSLWTADPDMTPYDREDLGRQIETLEHVAALPAEDRAELAQADSFSIEIGHVSAEGRYAEAADLASRRLDIQRDVLGDTHNEIAQSLDDLATLLQYSGDLEAPEPLFREALDIRRNLLGDRHAEVAASENNLAMLLQAKGDLTAAEPLLRDALGIFEEVFGSEDLLVATLTNNLGMLLYYQGDLDGAEPLYREALATRREQLENGDPEVANSLTNLAVLLHARGDYAQAEPLLREATAIWRNVLGPNHPHVGMSLNNLGSLANAQGEYAHAEALHREALAISQVSLGDAHPDVARVVNNLAHTLENQGDYDAAEPLFRRALEINRSALGEEHPDSATSLNNLAHLLQAKGEYGAAEPLYREALEIRRRVLGGDHIDVANSLSNLASLLEARGDYETAEALYQEALKIRRDQFRSASAAVAHNLSSIGYLYYVTGDAAAAEPFLEEAMEVYDAAIARAGEGLKRATTSLRLRPPARTLAAVRLTLGEEDRAWPVAERALARALADLLMTAEQRPLEDREVAREDSIKAAIGILEGQLATYRVEAALDTTGDADAMVAETRRALLSAEARWSAFRQVISRKYPVSEGRVYPLKRVQMSLPEGTAIIGWVDVESGLDNWDVWAYVLRDEGPVAWAACGPASPWQGGGVRRQDIQRLRGQLVDPGSSFLGVARDAAAVWQSRVAPIVHALDDVEELIVIPSGPMLGIPLEALVTDEREFLGETYAVSYAPSATVFSWLEERTVSSDRRSIATKMLLVGDPPFVPSHLEAMIEESSPDADLASRSHASDANRGRETTTSFQRLPASRAEVALLANLAPGATVLLGPDASEEALVGLAWSGELAEFDAIHIATHAVVDDERPERSALVLCQVGLPDPLEAAIAGTKIYDGFLTAEEIVREWELDAELVTLSACETGLGRKVVGEGYIGFAHAFLQVGARSLLVGLWKVDDEATSLLMRRFYENWTGSYQGDRAEYAGTPMTKADALREAKVWLRGYEDGRGKKPFGHPYYWAAFILIGDRQ
jgi:CHAT domain-containing protein/tetratricopeptide (TPR) repeat protein